MQRETKNCGMLKNAYRVGKNLWFFAALPTFIEKRISNNVAGESKKAFNFPHMPIEQFFSLR